MTNASVRLIAIALASATALAACSNGGSSKTENSASNETSASRPGKADGTGTTDDAGKGTSGGAVAGVPAEVAHRVAPTAGLPTVDPGHVDDHKIKEGEVKQPHEIIPLTEKTINSLHDRYTTENRPYPADPARVMTGPGSEIHNKAGLTDGSKLKKINGNVTLDKDGQVFENADVLGTITVKANNVTIRNVRVSASTKSYPIKQERGTHHLLIEQSEIRMTYGEGDSSDAAIGGVGDHDGQHSKEPGDNITVRNCFIYGNGDGIKVSNWGLYEGNYIRAFRSEGSDAHIDGIQSVGKSHVIIRKNFIDLIVGPGQFAGIFTQGFTGKEDKDYEDITITENVLAGGNFAMALEDGKKTTGRAKNLTVNDNIFIGNWRYGALTINRVSKDQIKGNIGKLVKGTAQVKAGKLEADAK